MLSRVVGDLLKSGAAVALVYAGLAAASAAPAASGPDFSSGGISWQTGNGGAFGVVPGSPEPMRQDPAHPFVGNGQGKQATYRIGDLANPNVKPWAKEIMKKDNDEVLAGKIAYTPNSSCKPEGVPAINLQGGPFYFVQTPKQVVILLEQDHQIRHVYLDVPHSKNPKPSWFGESIGHYEGDTLIVDTVGLNTKTFVDSYRTPHTEKLHVVERFKLIDEGKNLQVSMTIEDADTFNQPWQAVRSYRRVQGETLQEEACAENNFHLFDYGVPVAEKPDF